MTSISRWQNLGVELPGGCSCFTLARRCHVACPSCHANTTAHSTALFLFVCARSYSRREHCTAAASLLIPEASESFQLNQAKKQMGNDNSKSSRHPGQQICLVSHSRRAGTIRVSFSERWFSCWNLSDVVVFSLFSLLYPTSLVLLGEHLRVCPQGYTCCTSDMEDNLATLSRREMEGLLKNDGRSLQNALVGQYKTFDGECWRKERVESRSEFSIFYKSPRVLRRIQRLMPTFRVLASYRTAWQWNGGYKHTNLHRHRRLS